MECKWLFDPGVLARGQSCPGELVVCGWGRSEDYCIQVVVAQYALPGSSQCHLGVARLDLLQRLGPLVTYQLEPYALGVIQCPYKVRAPVPGADDRYSNSRTHGLASGLPLRSRTWSLYRP